MGPKRGRNINQREKVTRSQLRRKFGGLDIDEEAQASSAPEATQEAPAPPARHPTHGPTTIEISKFPVHEQWERIEEEERKEIARKHKARTGPLAFEPEYLPFQIHAAVPVHGRFTREIESDIVKCNTIEAIKDIAKNSLALEFKRTNMKLNETKFAGIMTYGPTNEFSTRSINNVTRGLFLDEDAFKKWWLTVNMTPRQEGDRVKVAVVLWHDSEAKAKAVQLPDFWTEENARVLGNELEKLDWPIFMTEAELEEACRAYEKMQRQVQEARGEAALVGGWKEERKEVQLRLRKSDAAYKKLAGQIKAMSKAFKEGDMKKLGGLLAAGEKAVLAKEKREEPAAEEVVGDEEEDEDDIEEEVVDDVDDSDDEDFVP